MLVLLLVAVDAARVSPTCALNHNPCPPPQWTPTWNLTQSTVIQPSSDLFFVPSHPWGLISLDWSVAHNIWWQGNKSNTTCEETSRRGCELLKSQGLAHRCFIYHNLELALQWLESQRQVMYDPLYAGFFLKEKTTGQIYNEPIEYGDQFFWDFRNVSAQRYYVDSVLSSLVASDAVDGSFSDDVVGVPEEHPKVPQATGLTPQDLLELQFATQSTSMSLIETLAAQKLYNWQAFGFEDSAGPVLPSDPANCTNFMRQYCDPVMQGRALLMSMNNNPAQDAQVVAAFLIVRPPYAYLGWGWESDDRMWNDKFLLQVGEPKGLCEESSAGVFTRTYTEGTAALDCNKFIASLPFHSL